MRLDDAMQPAFQLLITGDMDVSLNLLETSREAGVAVHRVAQERSYPSLLVEEDRVLADWLTSKGARAVLVRPDHVVFGTAVDSGEAEQLVCHLQTMLAAPDQQIVRAS
jgi:3-(3-hydroxy-phenyl)propionate hydroxylase